MKGEPCLGKTPPGGPVPRFLTSRERARGAGRQPWASALRSFLATGEGGSGRGEREGSSGCGQPSSFPRLLPDAPRLARPGRWARRWGCAGGGRGAPEEQSPSAAGAALRQKPEAWPPAVDVPHTAGVTRLCFGGGTEVSVAR